VAKRVGRAPKRHYDRDGTLALEGDMRAVLAGMRAESFTGCVTDPPYELGFMGKSWDKTGIAFDPETWRAVHRVLKPGAFLLAFGGTRTFHRMACAVEDAGFVIRDVCMWMYGQGFPKGYDVSKGVGKKLGAKRERNKVPRKRSKLYGDRPWMNDPEHRFESDEPHTLVAMKPCDGGFADNALKHGVAGLNVDGGRIGTEQTVTRRSGKAQNPSSFKEYGKPKGEYPNPPGRWPANVILSHDPRCVCVGKKIEKDPTLEIYEKLTGVKLKPSKWDEREVEVWACVPGCPVRMLDEQSGVSKSSGRSDARPGSGPNGYGTGDRDGWRGNWSRRGAAHGDTGTASRFFYTAKADKTDRCGSKHPTVKPLDLIQYLVRLITPPGGTVLDPFAGTGTTGMACVREGFKAILIEREAEYFEDIKRRLEHISGGDTPLFADSAAQRAGGGVDG